MTPSYEIQGNQAYNEKDKTLRLLDMFNKTVKLQLFEK